MPDAQAAETEAAAGVSLGSIGHATWLTAGCVALAGDLGPVETPTVSLVSASGTTPLEARWFLASSYGDASSEGGASCLLVAVVPGASGRLPHGSRLAIASGGAAIELTTADLASIESDLKTFLRHALAPHGVGTRSALTSFFASAGDIVPETERFELGERAFAIREALRERAPAAVNSKTKRRGFNIDGFMAVDERSFFVEGWMHHEDIEILRLTAVSPEGSRVEILDRLARFPRPDVAGYFELGTSRLREKLGFLCYFELDAPSLLTEGWLFEIEDERRAVVEVRAPAVSGDTQEVREALLEDPTVVKLPNDQLMAEHIRPAVTRLQEKLSRTVQIQSVYQHGTPPESPDVSIVVPVYEHIHHLEVQLSQFTDDPDLREADLIYVLDSPEYEDNFRKYAAELHPIYNIPYRVATLETNVGFAAATNAGARLARGRLLLLMNSDVLPDRPGWLAAMREFYDSTPGIGALGPKLLYEDDSIQHAGMYFHEYPDPGLAVWVDATYFKGMHRGIPGANVARPVPALSGACLMIDHTLFERFGGLQEIYVRGDYEDSHLCLQLADAGLDCWYLPQAELYHLEAQSYTGDKRGNSNRYNQWLHTRIWGERIASLMRDFDSIHDTYAGSTSDGHR